MLAGGIIILANASLAAFLLIAVGFTVVGIVARSGLLISLAVLALSSSIGARTDYMHATYLLGIQEPTVSIVLFSLVAVGAYQASKVLPPDHERLAIIAARTAILLVNFGFWIGSLRGDNVLCKTSIDRQCGGLVIVDEVFIVLWVVALTATGFWAARNSRLWVVNVVAVFGAIPFLYPMVRAAWASAGDSLACRGAGARLGVGALALQPAALGK